MLGECTKPWSPAAVASRGTPDPRAPGYDSNNRIWTLANAVTASRQRASLSHRWPSKYRRQFKRRGLHTEYGGTE